MHSDAHTLVGAIGTITLEQELRSAGVSISATRRMAGLDVAFGDEGDLEALESLPLVGGTRIA